jgi:phosphoketolase
MLRKAAFFPGADERRWARGYGVVRHTPGTRSLVRRLADPVAKTGDGVPFWDLLAAADRLTSAAMWLTVHDTYAKNVYLDGRPLRPDDFKTKPEGHTGSALNIIPAYVGYLLANALSGHTRGWVAEQGHGVSGIDCANVLVGNVTPAHEAYTLSDEGLTQFVRDSYSYRLGKDGRQASPRGSHVHPHTAGGILEGGYLGFAGLQYVHLPLKGERLVAFLSDGAFEEQRGSDWAPRWWRPEDSGLVAPIMIANGRRIDQRTTMAQLGGTKWLKRHLALNGFAPFEFDGRDPAAYAWAILEIERRVQSEGGNKDFRLPYGIAVTVKGYGFHGAGTNAAHNLPLGGTVDGRLVELFNEHARRLWVDPTELRGALALFQRHRRRPRERDHALAARDVALKTLVLPEFLKPGEMSSPMGAVDEMFVRICRANRHLRPRIGNPDEMESDHLGLALRTFRHRVRDPEPGVPEDKLGAVITALNEEAVACACLANKGGINLIHTYEAFGTKMYGAIRQEILFANHAKRAGRYQGWLAVPLVLTSHTYENGKNEQSHQDPSLAEALLGETLGTTRVLFVPDRNTAAAVMECVYGFKAQIWALVIPKQKVPVLFDDGEARRLLLDGAIAVRRCARPRLILAAVGAYQLGQALRASDRLREQEIEHAVIYLLEPRRFSEALPSDDVELLAPEEFRRELFPPAIGPRIFVTHSRAAVLRGLLAPLDTGARTRVLGYRNEGGTYDVNGMLFANGQSWLHLLEEAVGLLGLPETDLLSRQELDVLAGLQSPQGVIF